jgi:FkbM family methyltransferase
MIRAMGRLSWPFHRLWRELNFRGIRVPTRGFGITLPVWKRLFRGDYEKPEIDAVLALLRDGDRVMELGGGLGVVSGVALAGRKGIVLRTFDGNPAMIDRIRALHKLNNFRDCEARHEIVLPNPTQPVMTFHLHHSFAESSLAPLRDAAGAVDVPVVDFADVVEQFSPDMLICDIEGAEADLFSGIDLSTFRAVVIELHPSLIPAEAIARIFSTCIGAGLAPRIDLAAGTVVAFERASAASLTSDNPV